MLGGTGVCQSPVNLVKLPSEHSCCSLLFPRAGRTSTDWRFWACRARRASGVSVTLLPRPKNNTLRFLQAARPSPGPSDGDESSVLRPRAKGDAGAVVTWCLSTHHTEVNRRRYNLIYRKG